MSKSIMRAAPGFVAAAALATLAAAPLPGCARSKGQVHAVEPGECGPRPERTLSFPAEQLYGHIDGGAELFLEFGFRVLTVQTFQSPGGQQVDVETYHMESSAAALAIYLAKCGRERPRSDVPGRNTANPYQITMLFGSEFVQANNFTGDAAGLEFAASLLRCKPVGRPPEVTPPGAGADDLLRSLLPAEGLVPATEALVRGQFSLQPIVTLGEGDVLQLGGETWGAAASYERPEGGSETRIYVRYADPATAHGVLESLLANLDPYLTVSERAESGFAYTDWRGWPGRVSVEGALLVVHVPSGPTTAE